MAWSGTVGTNETINAGSRIVVETRDLFVGGSWSGQQRRVNTLSTTRYVGLTAECAGSYLTQNGTDGSIQDMTSERVDDSGQYVVVKVTIEYGTWS
jgi:hypothetical protein